MPPIPKRDDERRRRNKPATATTKVKIVGVVSAPPVDEDWHPIARDWFLSLGESAQSKFYEPSDWQQARLWAEVLSRQLSNDRISAQMMTTWQSAATELLTTEGARRRARMEVERAAAEAAPAAVSKLDDYRAI